VQVRFNEALIAKQLVLARSALETDGIISLAKMKTHGFMRITGAVKNQFGCVPGMRKGEFHVKMPRAEHFASMLVDVTRFLKPRLYILDGIMAMEGNGPGSGTTRNMKVLLLSSDPAALDAVFCRLIRMPARYVPTMNPAAESGLGRYLDEEIEICGDEISRLECPDFKALRQPAEAFDRRFPYYLKKWITARPFIDHRRCENCGICTEVCPLEPKAVRKKPGDNDAKPVFDYSRCIRCYCCQEMCPHGAIAIRRPLMSRLIQR
jgi:Pyruvate/2-oxoacid:ferredoxin oxidoreductase delta subunit